MRKREGGEKKKEKEEMERAVPSYSQPRGKKIKRARPSMPCMPPPVFIISFR